MSANSAEFKLIRAIYSGIQSVSFRYGSIRPFIFRSFFVNPALIVQNLR